jgi:hypothetical protein
VLRFFRKPPKYSEKLHLKTVSIIPMAFLLHVIVSMVFYGTPTIFKNKSVLKEDHNDSMADKFLGRVSNFLDSIVLL